MRLQKKGGMWHVYAKSTTVLQQHESPGKKEDANNQEHGKLNAHSRCHTLSGPCFKAKGRTTMYSGRKRGVYNNIIEL